MPDAVQAKRCQHKSCFHLQILEQQHQLSFHLQQQRLIELIRQGKTEEALEHAQEYLAPPGEEDPAFLEELGMRKLSMHIIEASTGLPMCLMTHQESMPRVKL